MENDSKFKSGNGQWKTKSLFKEESPEGLYTIPELKSLYLQANDPTEYTFANEHLGGWQHWQALLKSWVVKQFIEEWREELQIAIRSRSLVKIMAVADNGGKDGYLANRFLVEGGYIPKDQKGRPSKAQVAQKAFEIAEKDSKANEDYNRLFPN